MNEKKAEEYINFVLLYDESISKWNQICMMMKIWRRTRMIYGSRAVNWNKNEKGWRIFIAIDFVVYEAFFDNNFHNGSAYFVILFKLILHP